MSSMITIYDGPGSSVKLRSPLLQIAGAHFVKPEDLIGKNWEKKSSHLIMPGGRDRPYQQLLKGLGNAKIRDFVNSGGTYIGLCAGAYYGCSEIEFEKGTALEICEERELKFFPGKAVGPVYGLGKFDYLSERGARAAKIRMQDGTILAVYFNGGCTFEGDAKVLAAYEDLPCKPPAIIEIPYGKGKAILSGVHIETPADAVPWIPELKDSEEKRRLIWNELIHLAAANQVEVQMKHCLARS